MRKPDSAPKRWAIKGLLFAVPFVFIYTIATRNIEPFNSWMKGLVTSEHSPRMHAIGLALILASMLLVPIGAVVSMVPVIRSFRLGEGSRPHPLNLIFAMGLATITLWLFGSLVVDQVPCWMGVPNCD